MAFQDDKISRRTFLKYIGGGIAAFAVAGAGYSIFEWNRHIRALASVTPSLTPATAAPSEILPTPTKVSAILGHDLDEITRHAIDAIGGIESIVNPGEKVFIKPNAVGWGTGAPDDNVITNGARTKPEIVMAVADECLRAGASEVIVGEGAQGNRFPYPDAFYLDGQTQVKDVIAQLNERYGRKVAMVQTNSPAYHWVFVPSSTDLGQIAVSGFAIAALFIVPERRTSRELPLLRERGRGAFLIDGLREEEWAEDPVLLVDPKGDQLMNMDIKELRVSVDEEFLYVMVDFYFLAEHPGFYLFMDLDGNGESEYCIEGGTETRWVIISYPGGWFRYGEGGSAVFEVIELKAPLSLFDTSRWDHYPGSLPPDFDFSGATGFYLRYVLRRSEEPCVLDETDWVYVETLEEGMRPFTSISIMLSGAEVVKGDPITVSGQVDPAVSGATVTITFTSPSDSTFTRTVETEIDGRYSDSYLPGEIGPWNVEVSWGGEPQFPRAGITSQAATFTVIEPQPTSSLKIYVTDASGSPLDGVSTVSTSMPSGQSVLNDTTGSDGSVTFRDIKPGSYTFQSSKSGYVTQAESVSATSGETTEITITLEKEKPMQVGTRFPYGLVTLGLVLGVFLLWILQRRR